MKSQGLQLGSPVLIRAFKMEKTLEVWVFDGSKYKKFDTWDVCRISGRPGPKIRAGDLQVPEGFYDIRPASLNPQSRYRLSMNINYPNAHDRRLGRTGSAIMIHGDCQSAGCYAMSDESIDEIYTIAEAALRRGQSSIQVQSYPFRMTAWNMYRYARGNRHEAFWTDLKAGYDRFERTRLPPHMTSSTGRYQPASDNGYTIGSR
jgi:murein L,D-transpeptidase YafK